MHIGLITLELTGHLNPLTTLGKELVRRGHRVSLMAGRPAECLARQRGIDFIPLGVAGDLDKEVQAQYKRLGTMTGVQAMWQGSDTVALVSEMTKRDLPAVLAREHFDGLIIDQLSVAGFQVAHRLQLPIVIASAALMIVLDDWEPPPGLPLAYRRDWWGIARNVTCQRTLLAVHRARLWWKGQSIDPLTLVHDQQSGLARISQLPEFLNFPRRVPFASHCHFTGPWHEPNRDDAVEFPWEKLGSEPIIYASMGTLQNSLAPVFTSIIKALGQLPYQAVVSKGGSDVSLPSSLPENVIVVDYAPQLRLLERSCLAITHAGLNTALECLSRGVPMLCLPVTNDQPGVARRIEWVGAGRRLPVRQVTTTRLLTLLNEMLANPAYAQSALVAAEKLRGQDGLSHAADIVECAFTTRQRVTVEELGNRHGIDRECAMQARRPLPDEGREKQTR